VEGNLLYRDSIDAAIKDCRYIFHVAGDYRFWARDPREIFANNVQGTINLLEAARRSGVEKIVCTSTTGILEPGTPERLATEERLACPPQFKGPYKRSKYRSYLEVKKRTDAGWPIVTTLPTAPIDWNDHRSVSKWEDPAACAHGAQLRRRAALRPRSSPHNGARQIR
jgi:dihydroflavonol-4-reductase